MPDAIDTDPADADAPARPGRKRDPRRDADILAATLDVLAEVGYDGMTVDQVAARAKAGKATIYRRWPSKPELVLDAVGRMKADGLDPANAPDTGTLRGDLLAQSRMPDIRDGARKMAIMSGVVSLMTRDPEFADAAREAIVTPRARLNRALLERAVERGEISDELDLEMISHLSPALVSFHVLMLREPIGPQLITRIVDEVVLPACGLGRGPTATGTVEPRRGGEPLS